MRALETLKSSFAVRQPETLGRLFWLGSVTGVVAAGLAGALGGRAGPSPAALTAAGLVVALPRFAPLARAALGLGLLLITFSFGRDLPLFPVALLGLVLALEGDVTWGRAVPRVVGPVLGALWHQALVHVAQPYDEATRLLALALQASVGLFVAVGLAAAQVQPVLDVVAERLRGRRAAEVWQRVRRALTRLPRGAARRRLEGQVREAALRLVARHEALEQVDAALATVDAGQVQAELAVLTTRAEAAQDAGARAHLHQAMRVHKDTLEQAEGLARRRERLDAQAAADLAVLERAALSLELAPGAGSLADVEARLAHLGLDGARAPAPAPAHG